MSTSFNPTIPKHVFATVTVDNIYSPFDIGDIEYKGLQSEGFLFTGRALTKETKQSSIYTPVQCFLSYSQMKGNGKELKIHLENALWETTNSKGSRNKELFMDGLDSLNARLRKEVSDERLDKDRTELHISSVHISDVRPNDEFTHTIHLLGVTTYKENTGLILEASFVAQDEQLAMGADWMIGYIQNLILLWTPVIPPQTTVYMYAHDELWNLPFLDEQPAYYYRGEQVFEMTEEQVLGINEFTIENVNWVTVQTIRNTYQLSPSTVLFTDQNESLTHYHLSDEYKRDCAITLAMVQGQTLIVREIQEAIDLEVEQFRAKKMELFRANFDILDTMKTDWSLCVENLKSAHLAQWEQNGRPDDAKTSTDKVLGIAVADKIGISSVSVFQDYVFTELPQYVIKKVDMPKLTKDWKTGHVDIPMGAQPTQTIVLKLTESKLLDQYLPPQTDGTFEIG